MQAAHGNHYCDSPSGIGFSPDSMKQASWEGFPDTHPRPKTVIGALQCGQLVTNRYTVSITRVFTGYTKSIGFSTEAIGLYLHPGVAQHCIVHYHHVSHELD